MEATVLDVPRSPALAARPLTLKQLVELPDLRFIASPKFSSKFDQSSQLVREQHFGVLEQAALSRTSLIPRHGETDQPVIELELGFSLANADPARNPASASTSSVVVAPYGVPSLGFAKHPGDPQRELVTIVTVYRVRSADDRRTLFECKMRLHQQAPTGH